MVKLNLKNKVTRKNKKLSKIAKKVKKATKARGIMKSKKNRKNRISFKKMSKRKLVKTIKKAKKKLQRHLKKLIMKGGADTTYSEIPRNPNETPDSMETSAGTAMVANDVGELNVLKPEIKGGAKLPKSMKNKRNVTMKRLKKFKGKH